MPEAETRTNAMLSCGGVMCEVYVCRRGGSGWESEGTFTRMLVVGRGCSKGASKTVPGIQSRSRKFASKIVVSVD